MNPTGPGDARWRPAGSGSLIALQLKAIPEPSAGSSHARFVDSSQCALTCASSA
jgi:hypothetical protein